MDFEIVGEIAEVETFAVGRSIRELPRLTKYYGKGRWRKRKGIAQVRLADGAIRVAEVHLEAGDVLVQRQTIHNWENRGTEPCRIAFILIETGMK